MRINRLEISDQEVEAVFGLLSPQFTLDAAVMNLKLVKKVTDKDAAHALLQHFRKAGRIKYSQRTHSWSKL